MESLGLSEEDVRFSGEEESMGNWLTQVHLEKWPLKWSACMCVWIFFC